MAGKVESMSDVIALLLQVDKRLTRMERAWINRIGMESAAATVQRKNAEIRAGTGHGSSREDLQNLEDMKQEYMKAANLLVKEIMEEVKVENEALASIRGKGLIV